MECAHTLWQHRVLLTTLFIGIHDVIVMRIRDNYAITTAILT
ncbi:hypothetical protein [Enterobacillus tribolii]|uniref:Uncharacterized protein n=1 Tax=Enterobacillus tribolii TaxID=1487935 RepID=A0A370R265_9GAMM|nr:hypothetical protein [Enterobacillus tribolii]RDK96002.1 hypothetical protein C8D90_102489 [Enterobacillus tribolii]